MNNDFLKINTGKGYLTVKATKASGAVPVSGLNVKVSTVYNNEEIVVYNGVTNNSGLIEYIELPAPKIGENNLEIPKKQSYQINANYIPDKFEYLYTINVYDGLCVIQNINVLPNTRLVGESWQ